MTDVGKLMRTPNHVFEYAGKVYGKSVVAYYDSVDGGRLLIKEVPENELDGLRKSIAEKKTVIPEKKKNVGKPVDPNTPSLFDKEKP